MTDWVQVLVLALIQGITEFLPVSSSAHLMLPAQIWGWIDLGVDGREHAVGVLQKDMMRRGIRLSGQGAESVYR